MKKLLLLLLGLLLLLLFMMLRQPPVSSVPDDEPVVIGAGTSDDGGTREQLDADSLQTELARLGEQADYVGPTISITMVYSQEKEAWIRQASSQFSRAFPQYQVTLVGASSFEAAADILAGKIRPEVWSPASRMVVDWLVASWSARGPGHRRANDALPIIAAGPLQPRSLLMSPLVLLTWESLLPGERPGTGNWQERSRAIDALLRIREAEPGVVRLGHTNPSRASSGMLTLYLLALSYFQDQAAPLGLEQVRQPEVEAYLRRWQDEISDFPRSTTRLTADMFRFGPTRYRIISTYENLALVRKIQSWKAPGPFGRLVIGYPSPSLWADHPAVLLHPAEGDPKGQLKLAAARLWVDFLRDRERQEMAIRFGFRPVDMDFDSNNPDSLLYRVPRYDELPAAANPSGEVVKALIDLWHSFQTGQTDIDIAEPGHYQPTYAL